MCVNICHWGYFFWLQLHNTNRENHIYVDICLCANKGNKCAAAIVKISESDDGTHTLNIFAIILAQTRGTYKMG